MTDADRALETTETEARTTVLITGGAGDLGTMVSNSLVGMGEIPIIFDVKKPSSTLPARCIEGSVLDRGALRQALQGCRIVVHTAAWHGIHEAREEKDAYEFWDLNVTGTFNVLQTAVDCGIKDIVLVSSTSVDEPLTMYGNSKVIAEELARTYWARHGLNIIVLRPRAFIPPWNRYAYKSFLEWAQWFWKGAVHISDVAQSVIKSIELLNKHRSDGSTSLNDAAPAAAEGEASSALWEILTVDGAYQYTNEDLETWDNNGTGSTFKKHYAAFYDLATSMGLDPSLKPKKLEISRTQQVLNYRPLYSLKTLLLELKMYGEKGPYADRE